MIEILILWLVVHWLLSVSGWETALSIFEWLSYIALGGIMILVAMAM